MMSAVTPQAKYAKLRRDDRKKRKVCYNCEAPLGKHTVLCDSCQEPRRKYQKAWTEKRKKNGLCCCGSPITIYTWHCNSCMKKIRESVHHNMGYAGTKTTREDIVRRRNSTKVDLTSTERNSSARSSNDGN